MRSPVTWVHEEFSAFFASPGLKILQLRRGRAFQAHVEYVPANKIHGQTTIWAADSYSPSTRTDWV
jgi:hypothetical protein